MIDALYLFTAEVTGVAYAGRAAKVREATVTAMVLGHVVVIAAVVLGSDGVALEHRVEFGGTFQRWHTVASTGR